ncbi:DUF2726 domain-containing protein [Clostridium sediminicola]|uniref:DUF2726 domain-containing protein n=1 Tax=Clostridium sediminicola TaxID=3114879 RepID=UPI0031F1F046
MKNNKSNNSGCLAAIFPFLKLIKPKKQGKLPYAKRDDFLSNAELSFYKVLVQALQGEVIICTKVGLSDIFFVKSKDLSEKATYFNKIAKKHVDFLLCRRDNLKPICGIELDDSSHGRKDRIERDKFVNEVFKVSNLPLIRFANRKAYQLNEIKEKLEPVLHPKKEAIDAVAVTMESNKAVITKNVQKSIQKQVDTKVISNKKTITTEEKAATVNETPLCPKCNIPMVLRETKRGPNKGKKFYGCSNYPRCKEVKNI